MLTYFKPAFGHAVRHPRMILFIYLLTLVPGLVVAAFFYKIAIDEGNGSLLLNKLLVDFEYMIFTDFMRFHGEVFMNLLFVVLAVGGLYSLSAELLTGGIFYYLKKRSPEFKLRVFLNEGSRMFGKYLGVLFLELFALFLVLLLSGFFYFVFSLISAGGSEKEYILWFSVPSVLMIFLGSVVLVSSEYARFILFENPNLGIRRGFNLGVKYVFANFQTLGIYWIVVGLGVLQGLIYLSVDAIIGMSGMITVILMFLIQQATIIGRAFLKIYNFAVVCEFYEDRPLILPIPVIIVEADKEAEGSDEIKPSDGQ